jgi:hypothetical protein
MSIQKRSILFIMACAFASILYGVAEHYSSSIILYVTEQSLLQKAPAGTDPIQIHEQLSALLSTAPDQKAKMQWLLRISGYLEKVQRLAPDELDRLLANKLP